MEKITKKNHSWKTTPEQLATRVHHGGGNQTMGCWTREPSRIQIYILKFHIVLHLYYLKIISIDATELEFWKSIWVQNFHHFKLLCSMVIILIRREHNTYWRTFFYIHQVKNAAQETITSEYSTSMILVFDVHWSTTRILFLSMCASIPSTLP